MLAPSTVWGGGRERTAGQMWRDEDSKGFTGTRMEKQKPNSGGGGGRHTQGTDEPEQNNAPVPHGTGSGTVDTGAWWPGAFQQGGWCAKHCREAGKTFWELTSQALANLMSKPGVWGQSRHVLLEHRSSPLLPGSSGSEVTHFLCRKGPCVGEQVCRWQPDKKANDKQTG